MYGYYREKLHVHHFLELKGLELRDIPQDINNNFSSLVQKAKITTLSKNYITSYSVYNKTLIITSAHKYKKQKSQL